MPWCQGMLGEQQPARLLQPPVQAVMARRVDHVDPAAEHGDAGAAGVQGGLLGGGIDAERHAADHAPAAAGELGGEAGGVGEPLAGGAPRADHGESRRFERGEIAHRPQHRRRIGDLVEEPRPTGVARMEQVAGGTGGEPGLLGVELGGEGAACGMVEPQPQGRGGLPGQHGQDAGRPVGARRRKLAKPPRPDAGQPGQGAPLAGLHRVGLHGASGRQRGRRA